MQTKTITAPRLLRVSLLAALGAIAACGGDDNETPPPVDAGGTVDSAVVTQDTGTTPPVGDTCEEKSYSELSDACVSCTCGVDAMVAPSCQKPCWDFLACAFVAQMGKCASFAAGGMAMKPQLDACVGDACAAELAVPGSMVASAYTAIIAACARSADGTPAACAGDIGKFIAARPK